MYCRIRNCDVGASLLLLLLLLQLLQRWIWWWRWCWWLLHWTVATGRTCLPSWSLIAHPSVGGCMHATP